MSEEIKRRQFLANAWKGGMGLVGVAGLWTSWDLLQPLPGTGFGGKVRAVPLSSVPDTGVIEVPAARSYLVKINGEVMALSEKCTHLGCRTPFCASSNQFECPCHGTVFNRAGELRAGPAPRGLDRYPIEVDDTGMIYIDTSQRLDGPAPGDETINEPKTGPSCATESGH